MKAVRQALSETMIPAYRIDHDLCAEEFIAGTAHGWIAAPLSSGGKASRVKGHIWSVGDYMFTNLHIGAFAYKVEERHFQNQGPHALFERNVSGTTLGVSGGEDYRLSQDTIRLNGQRDAREMITHKIWLQEVLVPRTALDMPVGQAIEGHRIERRSTNDKLLFSEWDEIYKGLLRGDGCVPKSALDRLSCLMKIALGADPQREDVRVQARDALRREICRFVEQSLSDPMLSVELLLQRFALSRASLFRMFEDCGGVRSYIMERRTVRAVLDIWKANGARGAIQAASDRYGFSSAPNFNRAVRRLLGEPPGAFFAVNYELSENPFNREGLMRQQLNQRWASTVHLQAA